VTPADQYRGYWIWPVLDDHDKIEYWDVHDPDDPHGEGEPVAFGLSTKRLAQEWITTQVRDDRIIAQFERMTLR
jgi:hypothetical protein